MEWNESILKQSKVRNEKRRSEKGFAQYMVSTFETKGLLTTTTITVTMTVTVPVTACDYGKEKTRGKAVNECNNLSIEWSKSNRKRK